MKNCLQTFTKWIFCLLAFVATTNLTAQNVAAGFCDNAIDASCGVAITNQTTVGEANAIWDYPQCNSYTFSAPEKVYKFTTTSTGTIQIDLSIYTAKLDLDIHLLADNCSTPTCLAQSISSNANGQTEQIIYNDAPAGTYYLIVDGEKDAGAFDLLISCNTVTGCNLDYTATPKHLSCGNSTGSIDLDIAWGKAPFKIEWDNADNTVWNSYVTSSNEYTISNLPAGSYIVKITDAMGCVLMRNNIVLTNNSAALDATFSSTPAPCGSNFGWINIDVSNSSPNYWVTVTGPRSGTVNATSNTIVIKDMPPGNYEVTIEKGGCTKQGWVTVGNTDDLDFEAEVTNASCGGTGSFWMTVQGGEPTYTIEWWHLDGTSDWVQSASNSFSLDNLKPGEYTIKITGKNGCSKTKKVVMGGQSLDYALEANAASCGGQGSIWVTIANGTPGYVVEWTGPVDGWKNTDDNSFAIDNLPAGQYEISIVDDNGCKKEDWITIGSGDGVLDYALEANAASCGGKGSIWVTIANGTPGYVVEWTGPVDGWKNTDDKSFAITDLPAGQYEISIVDDNGCKKEDWITISNGGGALDFALEANSATCNEKGAIWVTLTNGSPTYTVEWWGPGVAKWATTQLSSFQLKDLGAGDYTVKITDENGCTNTNTVTIHDTGSGLDFDLETLGVSCGSKGSIWIEVNNGMGDYSVDVTGPNTNKWFNLTSTKAQVTDLGPGTYTVQITDKNGCTGSETIVIQDLGGSLDVDLEASAATCGATGSMWVTIKNGSPKYTVELWGPNNATFWAQTSSTSFKLSELEAGNFTLKITDMNGCTVTKYITVAGGNSNLGLALEVNNASCQDNGRIWVTINGGTAGYNLRWVGPTIGEVNMNTTGYQINNLKAGNYTISVKDAYGCTYEETVSVYGTGNNLTLALEANNATCSQDGYLWADVKNGEGPYQVSWTGATNGSMTVSNAGFQVSDLPAGSYTVSVTDKNGCGVSQVTTVYGGSSDVDFSLEANNGSCGQNGYVWVTIGNGDGPYHISWAGPVTGDAASSSAGYQINDLPGGTYWVTVKDKNGCQSVQEIAVVGTSPFSLTTQTTNASCGAGGEIWIDLNGGNAPYAINLAGPMLGQTSTSDIKYHFPNVPAGNYTLTVTDYSGCVVTKQIIITGTGSTITADIETNNVLCSQKGSAWLTMGGGSAPYTVSWTGPVSSSAVTNTTGYQMTNLPAGAYSIVITDKHGCYVNKSITINNTGNSLSLSLEANSASCGQKGAIWVTGSGGTAPYTIGWTGPANGSVNTNDSGYQITNLNSGTYTVTITDKNGCSTAQSVTVGSTVQDFTIAIETTNASCGAKGFAWITMNGGSANYNISWTGPTSGATTSASSGYRLDNLVAGTYTVTVKEYSGCQASQVIIINDGGSNIGVSAQATAAGCGGKGSIYATISGGTAGFSYSWTGPVSGSTSTSATGYTIADLPAGTYNIIVRDSKGCEATQTVTVSDSGSNIGLTTQVTAGGCSSKGSIYATISGGTAGFSYSWSGPVSGSTSTSATGYTIADLPGGTYTVTVRDSKGCSASRTVTVVDSGSNIGLTTQVTAGGCSSKGSIYATISGGTAGFSYSWSGPVSGSTSTSATGYTIADLPGGTYTVTVRDSKGCSSSSTVTVVDSGSNIGLTTQVTAGGCSSKGSIYATISGGTAGFSYSWTGPVSGSTSTSATGYTIADLPGGTYTVTVRDSKGCSASRTVTVIDSGSNIGLTTQVTAGGCSSKGSIYATISGGTAGFSYSWSGPVSGSTSTSATGYTIADLPGGTYTVTVRDSKGCSASRTVTVVDSGSNIGLTTQVTAGGCSSKGSIYATISGGTAGFGYSWSGPVSGSTSTSATGYTIADLPGGTYTVTVRDSKGCSSSSTVTVVDSGSNIGLTTQVTAGGCSSKGSIYATISGGTAGFSYSWSGPVSGSTSTSATGYTIADLPGGTYTVTVRDSKGCSSSSTVTVVDSGSNIGLTTQVTAGGCSSKGSIYATISGGTAGFSYSWTGPVSGSTSTSATGYTIADLPGGTYTVTVRDSKGCSASRTVTVVDSGSNIGLTTQVTAGGCSSKGSIYATISGGTAGFSYSWSGQVSGSTSTSATGYTIADLPGGTYTVTVRDSKGCSATETVTVTDGGNNIGLTAQVIAAGCGDSGSIYATISGGTAGFSYSWTGPVAGSVSSSASSYRIDNLPAGTYSVTVRDSKGCSSTQSVIVTGGGSNLTFSAEATNTVCGTGGSIWMTVSGGSPDYTYIWAGAAAGSTITAETGYNVQGLPAGTYNLTVKDANGCEATQTVTINDVGGNIGLNVQAKNASCDGKGSIYATISGGTAGFSYSWSGPVSGSTSTSATAYNIEDLAAGTYTITVRDSKGCSATQTITVKSDGGVLAVDLSSTTSVACEHDGTTLVSIGGGTAPYTISYTGPTSGSTQSSSDSYQVSGLLPGDYVFSITDANGCSGTRKITIYDNGSDLGVSLTPTDAACGSKGMMVVNISGGISNYIISWAGGGTNGTVTTGEKSFALTDLPTGTYTITVKDGIGCTVTESASVNSIGGNLGLQLVPKNDVCGQGGSIEVRMNGGTADYQIEWDGPISGTATSNSNVYTINGLTSAGNYKVVVRDANGCEANEWVAINTGGAVGFALVGTNATCNKGGNILVNISSGSPDYNINWSGPSGGTQVTNTNVYRIDNLAEGTYTITVKDGKGCEDSQSIVIDGEGTNLGLALTNTNTSCGTANGNINATVSNGKSPYTFSWTGPVSGSENVSDNSYAIWDLPAGGYTVSVIDANGCITNQTITISEGVNALGLSVLGKDAVCGQPSSIQVTISNGVPDFKIEWTGPTNGAINTSANSYTISDVASGEYTVRITDATNCTKAQVVVINSNRNDVNFTYESRDATCTDKGSIWLTISDGNGPYNIEWSGPSNGSSTSTDAGVQITGLDAGVYSVTVHDKNGCSINQTIEVKNTGTGGTTVSFANKPKAVTCNNEGSILLTMITGTAPYNVTWTGPTNGSRTASTTDILIDDLTFGTYTIAVRGAGDCGVKTKDILIEDNRVVLGVAGSIQNGVCGENGSVQLSWTGDRDPYTVAWTGTTIGSVVTNANSETISDLKNGTYEFTVTGFDGCSGKFEATIDNGGTANVVNFTYANSAKTISFTNLSSAGTYAWTFGDGATSTEMSPTHTYEKNGTYTVCLNVTNSCGTKQKCQTVSVNAVTSPDPSAKVVLSDMDGPKGTVLQLPVRVENCSKLGTLSGTIKLGNSNVATIMGLSPNVISPVYNSGNYTFSYLAAGTGMNITDETILFYINVQLIGGVGQSSTIDLSSLPVALELTCTENGFSSPITPEVDGGRVSITNSLMADVGGTVKTYWGDGVGDAMVTISSIDHEMNPMTSIDGEYTADEVPMGYEYTFTPSKTSNPANGLSTFGLFLTQKYILGYEPAQIESPYQVVAMDANCSGTLTTFDLFAMQQMLVGNITEFPGCDSWVFVSKDHEFPADFDNKNVFPYADSHTMMLESEAATADFIGVKVGDILGRAIPVDNMVNTIAEDRNRQILPIHIDQQKVKAGETFEVRFRASDLTDMVSFQLGLDFNPQTLEFAEFIPTANGDLSSSIAGVQENQLKISWYDPAGNGINTAVTDEMFTLKFVAKQNISNLLEQIQLNNRTFVSELHKSTNEAYRFKLELNSPINSTFKVHQNTPNPFKDFTTITIEMPKAQNAEIILHDNFGRVVRTINHSLKAGINQLPINRVEMGAGVYYYTVKTGDLVDTKRMLIIE